MNLIIYFVFLYVVLHSVFLFIRTIFLIPLEHNWKKEILDPKVHREVGKYVITFWSLLVVVSVFLTILMKIMDRYQQT